MTWGTACFLVRLVEIRRVYPISSAVGGEQKLNVNLNVLQMANGRLLAQAEGAILFTSLKRTDQHASHRREKCSSLAHVSAMVYCTNESVSCSTIWSFHPILILSSVISSLTQAISEPAEHTHFPFDCLWYPNFAM